MDGYQGAEKDVIILSLTRSNKKRKIGFLKDLRRMNVAITRAKRLCVVIGDSLTFSSKPEYKQLIDEVKNNERYIHIRNVSFHQWNYLIKNTYYES